jgi:hypothetical protein
MGSGFKSFESRKANMERKIVLSGIFFACVLFAIGLGVLINLYLLNPSSELAIQLLSALALPVSVSSYIFYHYYKHHFSSPK